MSTCAPPSALGKIQIRLMPARKQASPSACASDRLGIADDQSTCLHKAAMASDSEAWTHSQRACTARLYIAGTRARHGLVCSARPAGTLHDMLVAMMLADYQSSRYRVLLDGLSSCGRCTVRVRHTGATRRNGRSSVQRNTSLYNMMSSIRGMGSALHG
jgi:hypothetical protein